MSANFKDYSKYYDLLYSDKDYAGEVNYVESLIKNYSTRKTGSLLELGCGTGIHAQMMSSHGLSVAGIDLSPEMIQLAQDRLSPLNISREMLDLVNGDVRTYRSARRFDAVISLFHVLSYQVSDDDVSAMLETVSHHLVNGGLFIFDFWYGPAVLWQRPSARIKELSDEEVDITRFANPILRQADNIVDVNYSLFISSKNKPNSDIRKITETHKMRYFFLREINTLLTGHGFELVIAEEWITKAELSEDTWGACVVARKIASERTPVD